MIRYASTSLICVGITQVLIVVIYRGIKLTEVQTNLAATMLTSIPAYMLNKYWVWGKKGRPHMRREVIPFWAFTVAGWILSTVMVALASDHIGTPQSTMRTLGVMVASISGFGILWVLKYLFLDKIMFGTDHHTPYDEDFEVEEAVLEGRAAGATEL
jgi:putative flippase GtrA